MLNIQCQKKLFIIIFLLLIVFLSFAVYLKIRNYYSEKNLFSESEYNLPANPNLPTDESNNANINKKQEGKDDVPTAKEAPKDEPPILESRNVLLDIPFAPQAPFANWDDSRQQDGCEEASVLMVMRWVNRQGLTLKEAEKEIFAISKYERDNYGDDPDTSAKDTVERIIKGYFNFHLAEIKENISLKDIKQAIFQGNAVIIPADGQKLKNPYYTAPGPERHMLVIRGYDADRKQFITNDPGTRRGEKYKYDEDHLFDSIRDYFTGNHLPIWAIKKVMIVINGGTKFHN